MIYNIALVFNENTNRELHNFYGRIRDRLNLEFGLEENSIPHATIVKFESSEKLDKEKLNSVLKSVLLDIKLDFSGITLLPSHSKGCWIEMSILKTRELINIQEKIVSKLSDFKILSGIGDRFRPHITFCKIKDSLIDLNWLDYSILRKGHIKAKIIVGSADSNFELYTL